MQVIQALVQAGANCLAEDKYGSFPWQYAQDEEMRLAMKGNGVLSAFFLST